MKRYTKDVSNCFDCPHSTRWKTGPYCNLKGTTNHSKARATVTPVWCPLPDAPEPSATQRTVDPDHHATPYRLNLDTDAPEEDKEKEKP